MPESVKPIVVASKCLALKACRCNNEKIEAEVIPSINPHVNIIKVCANVEIGLGLPRSPLQLTIKQGRRRLIQTATGRDATASMRRFADEFLSGFFEVDGFIMKSGSPTCGVSDARVYKHDCLDRPVEKAPGMFAEEVKKKFPYHPMADEGMFQDAGAMDHFLTRLFTLARFRAVRQASSLDALADFHSRHQLLLMSCCRKELKSLEKIAANADKKPVMEVLIDYEEHLGRALVKQPRRAATARALMQAFDLLSDRISPSERDTFMSALDDYQSGAMELSSLVSMLRPWIASFGDARLRGQVIFNSYPEGLIEQ